MLATKSCYFQGQEILHMSNPGDNPEPDYDEEIKIEVVEAELPPDRPFAIAALAPLRGQRFLQQDRSCAHLVPQAEF